MSHFESQQTTSQHTASQTPASQQNDGAAGAEGGAQPAMVQVGSMMEETAERLEGDARLDQVADALDGVAKPLSQGAVGSALRGDWLGHALHPLLTDLPLGCWLSSALLDLAGGRAGRKASQRLVGVGLLFSAPTVAAGLAEYPSIQDRRLRRVAAAHAAGNGLVAFLYLRSWVSRRRGHHLMGIMWGMAGGMLAWVTGYLGGHLSMGRSVGTGLRGAHGNGSTASGSTGRHDGHERHEELIDLADRKSTRLNSSHEDLSRMPSSA